MMADPRRLDETPVAGAVPRCELVEWRARYGLVAGITTRGDGFDLGLHSPDPTRAVVERWHRLFADLSPAFRGFALGLQVHGIRVAAHDAPLSGWLVVHGTDGHLTQTPGTLLMVTVADCVPVYLAHPPTGGLALLHAGWRGTAAGILEAGVRALAERCATSASELVMHCGISICGKCYEVGPEVHAAVRGVTTPRPEPLDLRAELLARAAALGVERVSTTGWCAAHHRDSFFSHRRSGGRDGRMVAYLGVPLA